MMKALMVSGALAVAASTAQAVTVVAFEGVNGSSVAASVEGAGVTGFDLNRSVGLIQNTGGTFNSRSWNEGTDKVTALANNNAIFWGATIASGTAYDLTSLTFDYDRSGTGPFAIAVDLFINNVFQGEIFSDGAVADSASQVANVDLSAYTNVTGSVFFRLSGWGASTSLGTFDIENDLPGGYGIVVEGDLAIAAVPLPAGMLLLASGLAALGAARRRRT